MNQLLDRFHRLNSLQYLRALCALAVVLFHAESDANKDWTSTSEISLFSWGDLGVPMFFCLSGFIISYSGYLRPKKWWAFFYSRVARIYPAYIATTIFFITCLIILPSEVFNGTHSVSIEQIARTLLFNFGSTGGYVYVGWTLFYEMSFYFFFAFIIYRFPSLAKSKYFYYTISASLIICYSLSAFLYKESALMSRQFITNRISYFIIGMCIFLLSSKNH